MSIRDRWQKWLHRNDLDLTGFAVYDVGCVTWWAIPDYMLARASENLKGHMTVTAYFAKQLSPHAYGLASVVPRMTAVITDKLPGTAFAMRGEGVDDSDERLMNALADSEKRLREIIRERRITGNTAL